MAFEILLATMPLGAYLVLLGGIRARGRLLVTSGARDTFTLAMAISGLVLVGPVELFFPVDAATYYGVGIWPMLALLYALFIWLVVLARRPSLMVYGTKVHQILAPLHLACQRIDAASRLDVESATVRLPSVGIHLRIVPHHIGAVVDIEALEQDLSPLFWRQLLVALRAESAKLRCPAGSAPIGWLILLVGLVLLGTAFALALWRPESVLQGFADWFWR